MLYHKLELRNGRQSRHGRHLIFCAVSFDGVIISEGRYKFDRCFSLSCKICCYPLFQIRVKLYLAILMYRLIDTILKVKFAPSLIVTSLCALGQRCFYPSTWHRYSRTMKIGVMS